jgi:hypothetical protein
MAYRNDIVGRGLKDVEDLLKTPAGQTNKMGFEINRKKAKCVVVEPYSKNDYVRLGTVHIIFM